MPRGEHFWWENHRSDVCPSQRVMAGGTRCRCVQSQPVFLSDVTLSSWCLLSRGVQVPGDSRVSRPSSYFHSLVLGPRTMFPAPSIHQPSFAHRHSTIKRSCPFTLVVCFHVLLTILSSADSLTRISIDLTVKDASAWVLASS